MCKIIIFSTLLLLLSSCAMMDAGMNMFNRRTPDRYFPETVSSVPLGFISLNESLADMDGIINSFFWSSNFGFQDSERATIFQTDVKNSGFIVMYKNEFYINEDKFLGIVDYAMYFYEQINREYNIGDEIRFRGSMSGSRVVFSAKILSVDRINAGENTLYEFKFSVYPGVSEEHLLGMFNFAETVNGEKHHNFVLIDSNTVHLEIKGETVIDFIVLSNFGRPHATWVSQNSVRRVRVNAENRE